MMDLMTPGGLCMDIGAHHGESAALMLDIAEAGRVVCVEPCTHNYNLLEERWRGDDRVVPIHAAVLDRPGLATVSRVADRDGLTTMVPEQWKTIYTDALFEPPEVVPVITVPMLVGMFGVPDLLKIDVEGVESAVIRGMLGDATCRPRTVVFEFHGAFAEDAMECLRMLLAMGYRTASMVEEDLVHATVPNIPLAAMLETMRGYTPPWGNIVVMR